LWGRLELLGQEKKRRRHLLLCETIRSDCNASRALSKQSIDFRLSDFSRGPGTLGDPKPFDYLLILARQVLASREIRVCDPPWRGMESTHRARDRPLISHNSSDVAARAGVQRSRGRMKDLGSRFIRREVWHWDDFLLRSNVSFFDLRTPWQPAPSPLCLPIQRNPPLLNFVSLPLSHQVRPQGGLRRQVLGRQILHVDLAPHRELIICTGLRIVLCSSWAS
jgi:hypothetical protein